MMKLRCVAGGFVAILFLAAIKSAATTYTGEELFQGVYFGTGPVAQLFPELYSQNPPTNQPMPNVPLLVSNLVAQASVLNSNGDPEDAGKLMRMAQ